MTVQKTQVAVTTELLSAAKKNMLAGSGVLIDSLLESVANKFIVYVDGHRQSSGIVFTPVEVEAKSFYPQIEDQYNNKPEPQKRGRKKKVELIEDTTDTPIEAKEDDYIYDGINFGEKTEDEICEYVESLLPCVNPKDDKEYEKFMRLRYKDDWSFDGWCAYVWKEEYPCLYSYCSKKNYLKAAGLIYDTVSDIKSDRLKDDDKDDLKEVYNYAD